MHLLYALLVAVIVYAVGLFFDRTPNNRYAGLAAIVAFVLVLLGINL